MKINFFAFAFFLSLLTFSCGKNSILPADNFSEQASINFGRQVSSSRTEISFADREMIYQSIDELADLERAGSWFAGMSLTESGLLENAGDYAGAVAAIYKELAYAYGLGLIPKEDINVCLLNILDARKEEEIIITVNAILAFTQERWAQASDLFAQVFNEINEPDGFSNWMILVCALEQNGMDRQAALAYKAIRARYAQFPDYWYRGARVFSGAVSAEYAENCINIFPEGPYASECREILAVYSGLKTDDGLSIKTKKEIETAISQSITTGNPEAIDPLLPLISLPDNPYTIYAVSALRALVSVPNFRDYFSRKAAVSGGRLAERLLYISRG